MEDVSDFKIWKWVTERKWSIKWLLDLDQVKVPVMNRRGKEGQGWRILVSSLNFERLVVGDEQIGLLRELARYVVF
jgi:hypothetical protein